MGVCQSECSVSVSRIKDVTEVAHQLSIEQKHMMKDSQDTKCGEPAAQTKSRLVYFLKKKKFLIFRSMIHFEIIFFRNCVV